MSSMALLVLQPLGCSSADDDSMITGPSFDVDSLTAAAHDSLGHRLNEAINQTLEHFDSTFRPQDIDFAEVRDMYERAVRADPANSEARFGAAITGLMAILADSALNDLYGRFQNVYDSSELIVYRFPKVLPLADTKPLGLPLVPSAFASLLLDYPQMERTSALASAQDPQVSELQAILESRLMPEINLTQGHLTWLEADTEFSFTVTPMMQGNPGSSPIIIDRADLRLINAVLYVIKATLNVFFARNFDIPSYTAAGLQEAMQQSSPFLTLKSDGVQRMAAAKENVLAVEDLLQEVISLLRAEITDGKDHSNDLIKVYPEDDADLAELSDSVTSYFNAFTTPRDVLVEWEINCQYICHQWGCYYTCDVIVFDTRIDISAFFDNPVVDLKSVFPAYTVDVSINNDYIQFADSLFSRNRYWSTLQSRYGISYPNDTAQTLLQYGFTGEHLPDVNSEEFYTLISRYNQTILGWTNVTRYCCDSMFIHSYEASHLSLYLDEYVKRGELVVCHTWDALSFESWTWPNPTFNGFFPDLTSETMKNEVLSVGPFDWKRSSCKAVW